MHALFMPMNQDKLRMTMYMQALTDMTYYMGVTSLIETEVFMEDIAPSKHRYVGHCTHQYIGTYAVFEC